MTIWSPWKLPNFQDPQPPVHLRPKFLTPLTLDVQFQTNIPRPNDNEWIKTKHDRRKKY